MLEKIGLPPKPSLRGNNWVVDASHCQGCSSQFSFINRKHHCRRCGGIFCGSCTQQRMTLRGQGDSPVRICDPCKKLEEAARFELRHRHKSKASKGGSGLASKKEDDILNEIIGREEVVGSSSVIQAEDDDSNPYSSTDQASTDVESTTPEKLREKALDEKKKYRVLKDEGKSEEALRAYKRAKELERQAAALEISLRKSRRMASSSVVVEDTEKIKDHFRTASEKIKPSVNKNKEKDDLSAELRELGWSELELHEAEKKPANLTVESELFSLLKEVSAKPQKVDSAVTADKSQVLVHKKKALELKRAGNLAEAKEELKKAKILERKIEEEELLGGADDSDDELSLLIQSMDSDKPEKTIFERKSDIGTGFDDILGLADDFNVDGNFEVTDEDMEDPDMASALKSLGWVEEPAVDFQGRDAPSHKRTANTTEVMAQKRIPRSKLTIQRELIALKKKALTLRREGKLDESDQELNKAKVLEAELEQLDKTPAVGQASPSRWNSDTMDDEDDNEDEVTDQDIRDPTYLTLLKNMGWEDESNTQVQPSPSQQIHEVGPAMKAVASENLSARSSSQPAAYLMPGKSKQEIQRELLALKRKALTLRRQGETDAAEEVLENAKSLEAQLQEREKLTTKEVPSENASVYVLQKYSTDVDTQKNKSEEPQLQEKNKVLKPEQTAPYKEKSPIQEPRPSPAVDSPPEKNSISQEILAHKRKAVALKREGKLAEAKEELKLAKLLEKQADEGTSQNTANASSTSNGSSNEKGAPKLLEKHSDEGTSQHTANSKASSKSNVPPSNEKSPPISSRERFKLQQESLAHKRQALKLRREGKTAEAEAEFELAKSLESRLQELDSVSTSDSSAEVEDFLDPQLLSALQSVGFEELGVSHSKEIHGTTKQSKDSTKSGGAEAEQLAERIKSEKLMAVNLKRAGKQAEALAALRRAKAHEKKLQSLTPS